MLYRLRLNNLVCVLMIKFFFNFIYNIDNFVFLEKKFNLFLINMFIRMCEVWRNLMLLIYWKMSLIWMMLRWCVCLIYLIKIRMRLWVYGSFSSFMRLLGMGML